MDERPRHPLVPREALSSAKESLLSYLLKNRTLASVIAPQIMSRNDPAED
jgi:hypothetical protein